MTRSQDAEIADILKSGLDMTIATVRPDGAPQATVVSYASDGTRIYFGCGAGSQKAANLEHDPRVSVTVTLPYKDWSQIHGLSAGGRARRITDTDEIGRVGLLFMTKFPEMAQYAAAMSVEDMVLYEVSLEVVSILNYRHGFGHTEFVKPAKAKVDA